LKLFENVTASSFEAQHMFYIISKMAVLHKEGPSVSIAEHTEFLCLCCYIGDMKLRLCC